MLIPLVHEHGMSFHLLMFSSVYLLNVLRLFTFLFRFNLCVYFQLWVVLFLWFLPHYVCYWPQTHRKLLASSASCVLELRTCTITPGLGYFLSQKQKWNQSTLCLTDFDMLCFHYHPVLAMFRFPSWISQ